MYPSTSLTAEQRSRLHALARREALALRQAAIEKFWRDVSRHSGRALRWIGGIATRVARWA